MNTCLCYAEREGERESKKGIQKGSIKANENVFIAIRNRRTENEQMSIISRECCFHLSKNRDRIRESKQ